MSKQTVQKLRNVISANEPEEVDGTLVFTFVPKDVQQKHGPGGIPQLVPRFIVAVRQDISGLTFNWSGTPDDPGAAREEMEAEVAARMKDRETWIERVTSLVGQVEQWAKELGWSTRRVEKRLDDARIGRHRVPALLMQEDTCRILLEPIGRSSPGTDGVVDLYLMPAYDDIASLYFHDKRWNLQYHPSHGANGVVPESQEKAKPLSKKALEKVLAEMRQNAA